MTQPTSKRFVMEDKLITELALKAPIDDPTFTGTVTTGYISAGTISANEISTTNNIVSSSGTIAAGLNITAGTTLDVGSSTGIHVNVGTSSIAALNNTTGSSLSINSGGGSILLGNSAHLVNVAGNLTVNGNFTPSRGYMLVSRTAYTSNATFTKASWMRAVRVICIGGGGGGGGAAATAVSTNAIGASGCGGYVAETLITNIAGLGATENLVVGGGGTAGAAGAAGGAGGDTSFGTWCIAKGGVAGVAGASGPLGVAASVNSTVAGSVGDIIYPGTASGIRHYLYAASVFRPMPGGNTFFPGPVTAQTVTATGSAGASPGSGIYGVGGFAGINAQSQAAAVAGGIGAGGIIIVEVYA